MTAKTKIAKLMVQSEGDPSGMTFVWMNEESNGSLFDHDCGYTGYQGSWRTVCLVEVRLLTE